MRNKIYDLLEKPIFSLIFALLCGAAYFVVILELITGYLGESNRLIVWFFSPAVICGAALIILKLIKRNQEEGDKGKISAIFFIHMVLMIIAATMAAAGRM